MTTRQVKRLSHYAANDMRAAAVEARRIRDNSVYHLALNWTLTALLKLADQGLMTGNVIGLADFIETAAALPHAQPARDPRTLKIIERIVNELRDRNYVVDPSDITPIDDILAVTWGDGETP